MARTIVSLLLLAGCLGAQVRTGRAIRVLPAAIDDAGDRVVFGSSVKPDGTVQSYIDVYVATADGAVVRALTSMGATGLASEQVHTLGGAYDVTISPDGRRAAYAIAYLNASVHALHVIDLGSGSDRVVATDTTCPPLFGTGDYYTPCLSPLHFTYDGSRILHSGGNGLYLTNADGTGSVKLSEIGGLMASPQRVTTQDNRVVFTSPAPGYPYPIGVPTPTAVFTANLDGSAPQTIAAGSCFRTCFFGVNDPGPATISRDGQSVLYSFRYFNPPHAPALYLSGPNHGFGEAQADGFFTFALSGDATAVAWAEPAGGEYYVLNGAKTRLSEPLPVSSLALNDNGSVLVYNAGKGRISAYTAAGSKTIFGPKTLTPGGFSNQASFAVPASPGSFASIAGINFSEASVPAGDLPLPTTLAGVSVAVNGRLVPIQSITPEQITILLPQDTPAGQVVYQVLFADGSSTPEEKAGILEAAPAVFIYQCCSFAAALHAGTNVIADSKNPARPGEVLEFYGTGLGRTDPPLAAGVPAPLNPLAQTVLTPEVSIGGKPAQVVFSGLPPGSAGVYQVNAIVPQGVTGLASVVWQGGQFALMGSGAPFIYVSPE